MRDVWKPTRFALWNAYLLLTKEINRSKTEIQKELSLLRAPVEHQRPRRKEAGWRLTFHLAAGLGWSCRSGYPAAPRAPAFAGTQRAAGGRFAARSCREIPSAGESPGSGRRVGADWKGQEPATGLCAGLQRRWLAAALKDAHRQGIYCASSRLLNVKAENPNRKEMARQ